MTFEECHEDREVVRRVRCKTIVNVDEFGSELVIGEHRREIAVVVIAVQGDVALGMAFVRVRQRIGMVRLEVSIGDALHGTVRNERRWRWRMSFVLVGEFALSVDVHGRLSVVVFTVEHMR